MSNYEERRDAIIEAYRAHSPLRGLTPDGKKVKVHTTSVSLGLLSEQAEIYGGKVGETAILHTYHEDEPSPDDQTLQPLPTSFCFEGTAIPIYYRITNRPWSGPLKVKV